MIKKVKEMACDLNPGGSADVSVNAATAAGEPVLGPGARVELGMDTQGGFVDVLVGLAFGPGGASRNAGKTWGEVDGFYIGAEGGFHAKFGGDLAVKIDVSRFAAFAVKSALSPGSTGLKDLLRTGSITATPGVGVETSVVAGVGWNGSGANDWMNCGSSN